MVVLSKTVAYSMNFNSLISIFTFHYKPNGIALSASLIALISYFILLFILSLWTSKSINSDSFFTGERNSPWFLVAFGMIGASLSGVTFVSVPGEVNTGYFYYLQVVFGYVIGYLIIVWILLPLYYRLQLVSIYTYLEQRFGFWSYKAGATFFLLSRLLGSSIRMLLAANVLQIVLFNALGIPFWITVLTTVLLIWIYTKNGGIKTIVWTDTLQTAFMILSVILTLLFLFQQVDITSIFADSRLKILNTDWKAGSFFFKQILSGAFITIVMTGLDQDMMQKNLTCRSLPDARKNMLWFTVILLIVNFLFLTLGLTLFIYAEQLGITLPTRGDEVFPFLVSNHFPESIGVLFVLGIAAAAYSSADSTLTALTTSFCFDMVQFEKRFPPEKQISFRQKVHFGFAVLMIGLILIFNSVNDQSLIKTVLTVAGYTYGPLLGLFSFGLFTKYPVKDKWVPYLALLSPVLSYVINLNSEQWFWGYRFGFEILIVNGLIMFAGLWLLRSK